MKGGRHNSSRVPHVSTPANILATTDIVSSRHRDVRDRTPEEELPIVLGIKIFCFIIHFIIVKILFKLIYFQIL